MFGDVLPMTWPPPPARDITRWRIGVIVAIALPIAVLVVTAVVVGVYSP